MHPMLRDAGKQLLTRAFGEQGFQWRLAAATRPRIALTFDDGPDPAFTAPLLDELAALGARATFFVIGAKADAYPDLLRAIVAGGHAIGSHTWSHQELPGRAAADIHADLGRCRDALRAITGVDTRLFRPPRGRFDLASLRAVAGAGYRMVHWTHTYSDYQRDGLAPLLARFDKRPPRARDIVLLHDHNRHTIDALRERAAQWRDSGLGLVALSEAGQEP